MHEAIKKVDRKWFVECLENKVEVNVKDFMGNNALHWAAHSNQPDLVLILVLRGCSPRVHNELGQSPQYLTDSGLCRKILNFAYETNGWPAMCQTGSPGAVLIEAVDEWVKKMLPRHKRYWSNGWLKREERNIKIYSKYDLQSLF